eukprot:CAMPEP_0195510016 /NCGR_PEP_ID=MMETSP0794_2-20130614/2783_1 /TAXON_ID=515487 /ORGANISM="Stephanopyxis turris, Strain CCMP 815" /LENGTH=374 /DNA_ID=CAMNT_0040637363 /DNA_START=288 /DNA_END=1412 /DNA_ORIENTATION=+
MPRKKIEFPSPRIMFLGTDLQSLGKTFQTKTGREVDEEKETRERRINPPDSNDKIIKPPLQIASIPVSINGTAKDCVPMTEWQTKSYPTCNTMHETDLMVENVRHLGMGTIRSAWRVHDPVDFGVILKTLRISGRDVTFDPQRYESHRRDAMASEVLTSSPHVVDVYGYCGQSCFNEALKANLEGMHLSNATDKLQIAMEAAVALADVHSVDFEGHPVIVHRDVTHRNFLRSANGEIKINDFNVGRFLEWDSKANEPCGFHKVDCGPYRSPEECHRGTLSEKIDIYSLGNSIYWILTRHQPYRYPKKPSTGEISKRIKAGTTPIIPDIYKNSDDPAVIVLIREIKRCWAYDPKERPSAREVADALIKAVDTITA